MIKVASDKDFEQVVLKNDRTVLVDFYATWCGPCMMQVPVLEEVSNSRSEFDIVKVNVDESPEIASKYMVNTIPTLIVFENGKSVKKNIGFMNREQICDMMG